MMSVMRRIVLGGLAPLLLLSLAFGDDVYRKPPREILDVLNAPPTPEAFVSPSGAEVLLGERILYPPISDLAQPMLRLAGLRINAKNNGPHNTVLYRSMTLRHLNRATPEVPVAIPVALPSGAEISAPSWSPDARQFAFTNMGENAVELWVGDAATGRVHRLSGIRVNAALMVSGFGRQRSPIQWMPDSRRLLVETVPGGRGAAPQEPAVPAGPHTQESLGKAGPAATYEDLLKNAHDEDLFDYYVTAQLAFVDSASGKATQYGKPGIFLTDEPSPDGQNVLIARVHKPYSYFHPVTSFPKEVEVWNRSARPVYNVASLPLEDRVPIQGVPTGPRDYRWIPTEPASLYWVEALDGGNPKTKVPFRDRVMIAKLPLAAGESQELTKLEERFETIEFGESGTLALVSDYERNKRWIRTFAINPRSPGQESKLIWSRNMQDRYKDPGTPDFRTLAER